MTKRLMRLARDVAKYKLSEYLKRTRKQLNINKKENKNGLVE